MAIPNKELQMDNKYILKFNLMGNWKCDISFFSYKLVKTEIKARNSLF